MAPPANKRAGKRNKRKGKSKAIPTQVIFTALKQRRRNRHYLNLSFYCIFLSLYCGIHFSLRNAHRAFEQNDAVVDLLLDEEFPVRLVNGEFAGPLFKKNWYDIMTHGEFWDWVEGPLLSAIYPDSWYNGEPLSAGNQFFLQHSNRLLGGVQFRQVRVRNNSCTRVAVVPRFRPQCYGVFSSATAETAAIPSSSLPGYEYTHSSTWSNMPGKIGFGGSYGRGGYSVVLPLNGSAGRAMVAAMKGDTWTNDGTRAVAVNFNLYNPDTRLLQVVRLQHEFHISGRIAKEHRLIAMPAGIYSTPQQRLRAVAEAAFAAMLLYYLGKELRMLAILRLRYFNNLWNVLEALTLGLFTAASARWYRWIFEGPTPHIHSQVINNPQYVDLFDVATAYEEIGLLSASAIFLGFFKIFKLFRLNSRIIILFNTLLRAAADLAAMGIVLLLVMLAFAFSGHVVFGPLSLAYHNLSSSLSTLARGVLGEYDYKASRVASPEFAPAFFFLYVFIVFLSIMTMFIAVVEQFFRESRADALEELRHEKQGEVHSTAYQRVTMYLGNSMHISLSSLACCTRCRSCCGRDKYRKRAATTGNEPDGFKPLSRQAREEGGATHFSLQWSRALTPHLQREHVARRTSLQAASLAEQDTALRVKAALAKRQECREAIDLLLGTSELRLLKATGHRTDLYEAFMAMWQGMTRAQRRGALTLDDLTIILDDRGEAHRLLSLYNAMREAEQEAHRGGDPFYDAGRAGGSGGLGGAEGESVALASNLEALRKRSDTVEAQLNRLISTATAATSTTAAAAQPTPQRSGRKHLTFKTAARTARMVARVASSPSSAAVSKQQQARPASRESARHK